MYIERTDPMAEIRIREIDEALKKYYKEKAKKKKHDT